MAAQPKKKIEELNITLPIIPRGTMTIQLHDLSRVAEDIGRQLNGIDDGVNIDLLVSKLRDLQAAAEAFGTDIGFGIDGYDSAYVTCKRPQTDGEYEVHRAHEIAKFIAAEKKRITTEKRRLAVEEKNAILKREKEEEEKRTLLRLLKVHGTSMGLKVS